MCDPRAAVNYYVDNLMLPKRKRQIKIVVLLRRCSAQPNDSAQPLPNKHAVFRRAKRHDASPKGFE